MSKIRSNLFASDHNEPLKVITNFDDSGTVLFPPQFLCSPYLKQTSVKLVGVY
jgi:hypothetical protein